MPRLSRSVLAVAATAVAFGMTACSEPAAPASSAAGSGSAAGGASGAITVYTSEPQNKIDDLIAAFNKVQPNVKVNVFRGGTGDLKTRIDSETKTGKVGADVLLAADVPTFEGYKAKDMFAKYTPADASSLRQGIVDKDGYYVGTRIIPTVIMYNTKAISTPPKTWNDLTDPQYKGKIVMPNPDVSGAAAYNCAVWLQDPTLGPEWMTKLAANKPVVVDSNGPVSQNVAQGTQPVGIVVDYLVRDLAAQGSPVAVSYPTDGAPYITEPAAVFKDAKNPAAAQKFVDFLVSKQGQEQAVKQNYLPVRDDAGAPAGAPSLKDMKLKDVDPVAIAAKQKDAVAKFKEIVGA